MKKRILTILLILTLAASSMAGCTQSSNDTAPEGADSPAASQEPQGEPGSSDAEPGAESSGDMVNRIPAVTETGELVLITTEGEHVFEAPSAAEDMYHIGEDMLFVKGAGVFTIRGEEVFSGDFEYVGPFKGGLAPAAILENDERRYGFVDTTGHFVIEPQYKSAYSFSEGLAGVWLQSGEWAYIDTAGEIVLDGFASAIPFQDGLAVVHMQNGEWGFINLSGEVVFGGFGRAWPFQEGLAVVKLPDEELFGYIGLDGEFVIEPIYQSAMPFSEGVAAVAEVTEDFADRKYGYIDATGSYVLPPAYGSALDFGYDVAAVTFGDYTDNRYYMIDRSGNTILDTPFNTVIPVAPGVFSVREQETLASYFVDATGTKILDGYRLCWFE